ncbi:hypothetical protein RMR21_004365 [Agrobacterium sp. rho-8.1]|nr:hypothetical protein [Agrobacterium sp. rho-8.1]
MTETTETQRREFMKSVRAHGKTSPVAIKTEAKISRSALWTKAMKVAASGPRVRVEGD